MFRPDPRASIVVLTGAGISAESGLRTFRACGLVASWADDLLFDSRCPECGKTRSLRPHIVWFGERPFALDRITAALARCGAIGTSGHVYPAAGFVQQAGPEAHTCELNLDASEISPAFREHRRGPATQSVPALVDEWLRISRTNP